MDFLNSAKCDHAFDEDETYEIQIVHIWVRQRTGRKYITEVNGLAEDLNLKKIIKCWRHIFHVSVAKAINSKDEKIIRLQGDQRDGIFNFLLEEKIITKEYIKVHGF